MSEESCKMFYHILNLFCWSLQVEDFSFDFNLIVLLPIGYYHHKVDNQSKVSLSLPEWGTDIGESGSQIVI